MWQISKQLIVLSGTAIGIVGLILGCNHDAIDVESHYQSTNYSQSLASLNLSSYQMPKNVPDDPASPQTQDE